MAYTLDHLYSITFCSIIEFTVCTECTKLKDYSTAELPAEPLLAAQAQEVHWEVGWMGR